MDAAAGFENLTHLTPPSAPGTTTATSDGERASSKKPVVRRAPKQFTPKAARRLAANAFQEIMAARLEDQWKTLSARNAKKGSYRQRLFTDTMRQLPQSQKVYRHDRCCPRREQTWKPAALKWKAFWRGIPWPLRDAHSRTSGLVHLLHHRHRERVTAGMRLLRFIALYCALRQIGKQ